MNNDCYKCEDRTVEPNCHITCEKYAEFLKKNQKRQEICRYDRDCYTSMYGRNRRKYRKSMR